MNYPEPALAGDRRTALYSGRIHHSPRAVRAGTPDTLVIPHAESVKFNSRWQRHRITSDQNPIRPCKGRIHFHDFNATLTITNVYHVIAAFQATYRISLKRSTPRVSQPKRGEPR